MHILPDAGDYVFLVERQVDCFIQACKHHGIIFPTCHPFSALLQLPCLNIFTLSLFPMQALIKQDNLDAFNEKDPYKADDSREDEDDNDDNDNSIEAETFPLERDEVMPPPIPHPPSERVSFPKGLPWAPKVRYCPV